MSQVVNQNITTEARTANIAGLVVVIGSTVLQQGMVKPEDTMVYHDLGNGTDWVPLFSIALPNSNNNMFGNVVNKYSNISDIIKQLHRQSYLNAYESAVTPLHVDREAVSKLLLTAAGVVGVNVWNSLANPQDAVKGSFVYDNVRVLFSRRVEGSNFVTEFEELNDETYILGNHQVFCDGEPMSIPGVTTQTNAFINSVIATNKTVITVAGNIYNPAAEQVFRAAAIDGGAMLTPEEQFATFKTNNTIPRDAVVIDDGTCDNYLVTARHDADPELYRALSGFNAVQVPGAELGEAGDTNPDDSDLDHADDENYALKP